MVDVSLSFFTQGPSFVFKKRYFSISTTGSEEGAPALTASLACWKRWTGRGLAPNRHGCRHKRVAGDDNIRCSVKGFAASVAPLMSHDIGVVGFYFGVCSHDRGIGAYAGEPLGDVTSS
jgi:hypothetical protein